MNPRTALLIFFLAAASWMVAQSKGSSGSPTARSPGNSNASSGNGTSASGTPLNGSPTNAGLTTGLPVQSGSSAQGTPTSAVPTSGSADLTTPGAAVNGTVGNTNIPGVTIWGPTATNTPFPGETNVTGPQTTGAPIPGMTPASNPIGTAGMTRPPPSQVLSGPQG